MRVGKIGLVIAVLMGTVTGTGSAETLLQQADRMMKVDYVSFVKFRHQHPKPFDWNTDQCSTPIPLPYRQTFAGPCEMHDFGYRNYGYHGTTRLRLDVTEKRRAWVDGRFKQEMDRRCNVFAGEHRDDCLSWASKYASVVRNFGAKHFFP
ncbi:hypothetical protein GCM10022247_13660 [Allokutzneria multivorans]|uniref:Prokaryotic phospholipase A2 n=1 Tax=Allokutzneria multivorans TaxID=1142134 RepID=A0ABP7RB55_9PSEU